MLLAANKMIIVAKTILLLRDKRIISIKTHLLSPDETSVLGLTVLLLPSKRTKFAKTHLPSANKSSIIGKMFLLLGAKGIKWLKVLFCHLCDIKINQKKVFFAEILGGEYARNQLSQDEVLLELRLKHNNKHLKLSRIYFYN